MREVPLSEESLQRPSHPSSALVLLVPVALSFAIGVFGTIGLSAWNGVEPRWGALSAALAAAAALTLLAARRFPGPVVAVIAALGLVDLFVPPDAGPPLVALAFAIVGATVRGARVWAIASVGGGWLAAMLVSALTGPGWHPARVALATLALAACFAIGEGMRSRLERAEQRRRRLRERRLADEQSERSRMARELHDVLAHSLSQISVQSGVGLHLFDRDPEAARAALAAIRSLSANGLDEVRGVITFLRGDEPDTVTAPLTPQPQLADLPRLAAQRTGLGLTVTVEDRIGADLPAHAVQATAYRIIQEALTNVVRHSSASEAWVTVSHADDTLVIQVADNGAGLGDETVAGGGIRGMRERAALAGGTLTLAPRDVRGLAVEARLPWAGQP